ncbi:aromatic acid exporter family protein [Streptomyces sp. NPDC086549]|uniref:aromatic acid exporter family protein n=1 Tax=Streptomyces sp. NPDC086549 TaxID=3365752 RepID=UPI0038221FC5
MQDSTIVVERVAMPVTAPVHALARRIQGKHADHVVHGVKTVIAALLTWAVVAPWVPQNQPYLAVATAVLMVNASTVYESVRKAAQSVVARIVGLILALVTARLLGPTAGAVTVIALIAVLAGPRRTADDRLQQKNSHSYLLRGPARGPLGSGPGMAVAPCRADDMGGGVTGPEGCRRRR